MRRKHALGHVRRTVASGDFGAADVKRWKEELGDEAVDEIVEELTPKKPARKKAAGAPSED